MNREIKFRAWNGRSMIHGGFSIHASGQVLSNEAEQALAGLKDDDFPVMQFAELKDKNGKDIYEGDVVSDHVGIGVVEYSSKHAGFRVNYKDGYCKWFYDYNLKGELESIEITGNIFQNPDLIN